MSFSSKLISIIVIILLILGGFFTLRGKITLSSLGFAQQKTVQVNWSTYTDAEKNYTVSFPAAPKKATQEVVVGAENIRSNWDNVSVTKNGDIYRVDTIAVPDSYITPSDTKKTLTQDAKMILLLVSYTASPNPINPRFFVFHGNPAIEYQIKDDDNNITYRMTTFNIGTTIYSLGVGSHTNVYTDYDKFLSSFSLASK